MIKGKLAAKILIISILLVHLVGLLKFKFTAWPEMTFWPYLILKGWLPYRDIAIAHTPLLLADLSIFYKIFGLGIIQLKIYTWILILGTDLLLYWVVRRLWDKKTALISLLLYIPLQIFFEGNGLWFDLALAPLALAIYYNLEKKNFFWLGIWWGSAFLTKQTAFWFLIPIIWTIVRNKPIKSIKKFVLGAGIMGGASIAILLLLGIWGEFWLWAIKFGITKLPTSSGQIHFPSLGQLAIVSIPFLLLFIYNFRVKNPRPLLFWALFASMGAVPRWELFHFQPAVPFLAIGLGCLVLELSKLKFREKMAIYLGLGLLILFVGRGVLRDFDGKTRFYEPGVQKIAKYIEEKTNKNDLVYVANAWDSLYVLSDTLPSTRPWLPFLPWYLEISGIQEVMVANMILTPPKLIIQGEYQESGLGAYKPELINNFISENYSITDKVDGYLIWSPK